MKRKKEQRPLGGCRARWGCFEGNSDFLLIETALPPSQSRSSSPPFPKPRLAGVRSPNLQKRGGKGKGKGVRYAASLPGCSAPCTGTAATGERSGLVWSVLSSWKLGIRALTGGQGCPPTLCLLLPAVLGSGPNCIFWETCLDWEPGPHTSGLQGRESHPPYGKMESGSVGSVCRQGREGKRGGGRRQHEAK